MDVLTFGAPRMLKNFFDTESARTGQKRPVYEIDLQVALEELGVTMAQVRKVQKLGQLQPFIAVFLTFASGAVHRLLHPLRLRLPSQDPRGRAGDRLQACRAARSAARTTHRAHALCGVVRES
jgi:hypothetical protein